MKETRREKKPKTSFTIEEIIKLSWKFGRQQGKDTQDTENYVNEILESLGVDERIRTDYRVNVIFEDVTILVD